MGKSWKDSVRKVHALVQPGQKDPSELAPLPTEEEIARRSLALQEKGDKNVKYCDELANTISEILLGVETMHL